MVFPTPYPHNDDRLMLSFSIHAVKVLKQSVHGKEL